MNGNLVSVSSGDMLVNTNGRVVIYGSVSGNDGGTILTINNGGQVYIHGNLTFTGGNSSIVNNNSIVPYGLYVNGSVSNSGGGSSTSVNRTNLNTMYSSNQSFFDWISQTPNSPVTENNLPIAEKNIPTQKCLYTPGYGINIDVNQNQDLTTPQKQKLLTPKKSSG